MESPAWRFRSGSRLGRRTPRNGTLPVHDLHRMGREACCRHDIAYLVSWWRVTHLQRCLKWGNASRPKSLRAKIHQLRSSKIVFTSDSDAYFASPIEPATRPLSGPCNAPPPARAGRTARRFGAPLTPHLVRRPLCGEPLLPPTFRRRVTGVPPVRRGALRLIHDDFQFKLGTFSKSTPLRK